MESQLVEIATEHGWTLVAFEVMADHVHVFARVHPSDAPSEVARAFKGLIVASCSPRVSDTAPKHYIEHQWDKVP